MQLAGKELPFLSRRGRRHHNLLPLGRRPFTIEVYGCTVNGVADSDIKIGVAIAAAPVEKNSGAERDAVGLAHRGEQLKAHLAEDTTRAQLKTWIVCAPRRRRPNVTIHHPTVYGTR
jgi:hypothetical protein